MTAGLDLSLHRLATSDGIDALGDAIDRERVRDQRLDQHAVALKER
ncbi:MAG TPA: hypothetical protein QGH10_05440 [Armatimonadota bacterium]|nr:hypothetical protein [Armatimonadota bacterium]